MMTFRKLSAASVGKMLMRYFTQHTPQPTHDFRTEPGKVADSGDRMTSYYTGRDSRATWRPDMSVAAARALGIDHRSMPKDEDLARLFEAKRGDTGEDWSAHTRKVSAFDFTVAPHKSVTLAAEFAQTASETAMIWHAIDRANDATMRYVARELGWARKGKGGEEGAEPGAVGWVSFRHHTARPTVAVQDGKNGETHLIEAPVSGDPHAHIHNAMFNMVVTADGRIGSLDTKELTKTRLLVFGAYFQAKLADELRSMGIKVSYHDNEMAIVLDAIPTRANEAFSNSKHQVLRTAKQYAVKQGMEWDGISAEGKQKILAVSGLISRLDKFGDKNERQVWLEKKESINWTHDTVLHNVKAEVLSEAERFDRAYRFAEKHLAKEFHTAAVIDHDKLRLYATRGLIGTGIAGGTGDIDKVVELIENRGIQFRGEHVALVAGMAGKTLRVTNTAQIRIEQSLATEVARASRDTSGALSVQAISRAIDLSGLDFTSEPEHGKAQKAAIYSLGQGAALSLLTGVAGSGKTTLLKPLVAAWQADTRFDAGGREVVGAATAWRQADALKDTGIKHPDALKGGGIKKVYAMMPLLAAIEEGKFVPTRNTVLVIDEISQVAPRALLSLLETQRKTGMTIKALGDREQAQSIEAGDTIEIMRRVLSADAMPELLSTVRQVGRNTEEGKRLRTIAGLFRGLEPSAEDVADLPQKDRGRKIGGPRKGDIGDANADQKRENQQNVHLAGVKEALKLKQNDGSAMLVGGDQDQVLGRIADLYMQRRDVLRLAGSRRGVTASVLTNADAYELSEKIRDRMKERGELGKDERLYDAVDQNGEKYVIPIATGDRVRLYRRTWAQIKGKGGSIGNNGDIVEVVGRSATGLMLRDKSGRVGDVTWERLEDSKTGRLMVGFGHAMTVDSAQGITSDEHINALPRGTSGMTGFTAYVAESRARGVTWTMVSEEATLDALKSRRALGDLTPITKDDVWEKIATDMASKPYKALGVDLLKGLEEDREQALKTFLKGANAMETMALQGRSVGREVHDRIRADAVRGSIPRLMASLKKAIAAEETTLAGPISDRETHLRDMTMEAEVARRKIEQAVKRHESSPSAGP